MKITRSRAIHILKYLHEHPKFYFPLFVVNQKYSDEDDDFVEICPDEWENIDTDEKYQTFELWENVQNLDYDTTELMAKGFLDVIEKEAPKHFMFYSSDGFTQGPNNETVENLQILGWATESDMEGAFINFKGKASWITKTGFSNVTAVEMAHAEPVHFNLKD